MRRRAWLSHPPAREKDEAHMRMLVEHAWAYPRLVFDPPTDSRWIWIHTGKPMPPTVADYLADDWEVLRETSDR